MRKTDDDRTDARPASGRRVSFGTVPDFAFAGPGVRVEDVVEGSPAERGGVLPGDVLTEIDGREIENLRAFSSLLRTLEPGQTVRAKLTRGSERVTVAVTVVAR